MERRGVTWTDYQMKYKVLNKKKDMRICSEAMRYWATNGLASFFEQVAIEKLGNIDPEKLLRMQIITDALREGENQMANRKIAVDILGMKMKKKTEAFNLKKRGGAEIIEITSEREGGGFLKSSTQETDIYHVDENDNEDDDDIEVKDSDDDFSKGFDFEDDNQ